MRYDGTLDRFSDGVIVRTRTGVVYSDSDSMHSGCGRSNTHCEEDSTNDEEHRTV